jgi:hypothetical protein
MSKVFNLRLKEEEIKELQKIAVSLNYYHGGKPSVSKVMKDVANGDLIIAKKI